MPTPLTNKQQYWSTQLEKAEAFDGSIADYARSQGVSKQTLYRWRHCLRQREVAPLWSKTSCRKIRSVANCLSLSTVAKHR
jgi:transposase-like protein